LAKGRGSRAGEFLAGVEALVVELERKEVKEVGI